MSSPSVGCTHPRSSTSPKGAINVGDHVPLQPRWRIRPLTLFKRNPQATSQAIQPPTAEIAIVRMLSKRLSSKIPPITVIHRFVSGAGAGGCLQVVAKVQRSRQIFRPRSRTENDATTGLAPKGVRRHSQRFRGHALSHGHQKMKEFAKSAFTPSDKALVLVCPIQHICSTELILDMTSYRRSRINMRTNAKRLRPRQKVDGAGVVGDGVGTCPMHRWANHLAGKQHYHKITR